MPETSIYILAGPVQSGKTTSLIQWCSQRSDVYGILTPDVQGRRIFVDAHTKEQFPMEAIALRQAQDEETISIGRFAFSKANFEKAIQIIRNAIHKPGWLIFDEIGPLELRGEGFHDVLKEVLSQRMEKIVLVVREGLAEKVKLHFGIGRTSIITDLNFFIFK